MRARGAAPPIDGKRKAQPVQPVILAGAVSERHLNWAPLAHLHAVPNGLTWVEVCLFSILLLAARVNACTGLRVIQLNGNWAGGKCVRKVAWQAGTRPPGLAFGACRAVIVGGAAQKGPRDEERP